MKALSLSLFAGVLGVLALDAHAGAGTRPSPENLKAVQALIVECEVVATGHVYRRKLVASDMKEERFSVRGRAHATGHNHSGLQFRFEPLGGWKHIPTGAVPVTESTIREFDFTQKTSRKFILEGSTQAIETESDTQIVIDFESGRGHVFTYKHTVWPSFIYGNNWSEARVNLEGCIQR